jgi:NADH:ubiquinone oxidoreductase subunit F (NADH-binding)
MDVESRLLPPTPFTSLGDYLAAGGGRGLEGARAIGPAAVVDEIATAGLRGRGGAGFPTGTKWRSVARGGGARRYAVANGAEGEPGTFKDRALLRANPYAVLEGLLVSAEAVGALETYVALKASFRPELAALQRALTEVEEAGWLRDRTVTVVTGPEEYLFGEEKALLEVIEGNDPLPRWLPPYMHGLFATAPQLGWESAEAELGTTGGEESNPTLVNNVETLAQAAWILNHGADAFRSLGTAASPGTVLCTVVGDVVRPGVVEVAMGTPLAEVIAHCGGTAEGRTAKAVLAGIAAGVLPASRLGTPLTYEDLEAAGSGLGAGGFVVYDDSACMVEVACTLSRFLWVESCGQCPPCKLGTGAITGILERLRVGRADEDDLGQIEKRLRFVADGNRCFLPVQEQLVIASILREFPEDVAAHLEGWCPSERTHVPPPKILDLAGGVVTWDARQERKRPDWTYAD